MNAPAVRAGTAYAPACQREAAARLVFKDMARDQEAADHKKYIHPDESTRDRLCTRMKENDGDNRNGAQAIDLGDARAHAVKDIRKLQAVSQVGDRPPDIGRPQLEQGCRLLRKARYAEIFVQEDQGDLCRAGKAFEVRIQLIQKRDL